MQHLIVFFRLKPGSDRGAYEHWARTTDLPIVRGLPSVASFDLHRIAGIYGSDAPAPYDYVEVIGIADPAGFGRDVASATMRRVAGEFREFADQPLFLLSEPVAGDSP